MTDREQRRGHYVGTEVDERWWSRYAGDGLGARGLGDWWLDGTALRFHRRLTRTPIAVAFADVLEVRLGTWHAGQWAGGAQVVKVVWARDGLRLSSGFVVGPDPCEAEALAREIRSRARRARALGRDGVPERPAVGG